MTGPSRRALLAGAGAALVATRGRAEVAPLADGAGRLVRPPAAIRRVFPAGPPAAILLYTLAPDLLAGWTRSPVPADRPFLLSEVAALPEVGRITGRGNTANLEAVLAAKPDLILDIGSTSATYASLADRVQEQTGIPYALLDGTLAATPSAYRLLGRLLGREKRADSLATYSATLLERAASRVSTIVPDRRPRVYYARGTRGLETARGGSINVETLDLLGGINVAGDTKGGLATVSLEQVLAWDPDVIVTIDAVFARQVRVDPAWAGLKAVREGRVHLAPASPFGWIDFPPSVNRLIGVTWLGQVLYPALFPEDVRAEARAFYGRFYHVTPTEAEIAALLAPA